MGGGGEGVSVTCVNTTCSSLTRWADLLLPASILTGLLFEIMLTMMSRIRLISLRSWSSV